MKVAGFDIGGANTDLAVIDFDGDEIKNIEVDFAYLPMWSNNDDLSKVLVELIENIYWMLWRNVSKHLTVRLHMWESTE